MGKFEKCVFFAHFGHFSIILKQNLIFQTISLVIMALWALGHPFITIWHLQLQKMHLGYFNFGMLGPNVTPNVQHK